jgi:hypothetical protein
LIAASDVTTRNKNLFCQVTQRSGHLLQTNNFAKKCNKILD